MPVHPDLDQHYESEPGTRATHVSGRYPRNHVQFAPFLRPLEWYEPVARFFGARPLRMTLSALSEYDRAEPYAQPVGTAEEVQKLRDLLELHCKRIDESPFLSAIGRLLMKAIGVSALRARTQVLRHYHEHRESIDARGRVQAPLLIAGTPRSGTTLLHRLLSEDPSTRSPYTYEMEMPLPPLEAGADPLADPRLKKSAEGIALIRRLAPGFLEKFAESHYISPTELEECFTTMMPQNGAFVLSSLQAGREYVARLVTWADKRPIFRYERLFLKLLDAYRPVASHWTLKAPNYALYFPLVFDEYPDARVVLTHRSPLDTLPSACRLAESWCIAFNRDRTFDKHRFGEFVLPSVRASLEVPLAYRKVHPERESQILDCMYDELIGDPMAMVRRVYDKFDLELTPDAERRMRAYLEGNQQGKHGRHKYSLEEYGFVSDDVSVLFRDYMDRYGFGVSARSERHQGIVA